MPKTSMTLTFQGRKFPVYDMVTEERPKTEMLKVMYLNTTRNIAGSVQALTLQRLYAALKVQARCCRTDDHGEDTLEPRP